MRSCLQCGKERIDKSFGLKLCPTCTRNNRPMCVVEGCKRHLNNKVTGLCTNHSRGKCSIEDCTNNGHAKGLCSKHFRAETNINPSIRVRDKKKKQYCKWEESSCSKPTHARGYCPNHYRQSIAVRIDKSIQFAPSPDRPHHCPVCNRYVSKVVLKNKHDRIMLCQSCYRNQYVSKEDKKVYSIKRAAKRKEEIVHIDPDKEVNLLGKDMKTITINIMDLAERTGIPHGFLSKYLKSLKEDQDIIDYTYDPKTLLVHITVPGSLDLLIFGGLNQKPSEVWED